MVETKVKNSIFVAENLLLYNGNIALLLSFYLLWEPENYLLSAFVLKKKFAYTFYALNVSILMAQW